MPGSSSGGLFDTIVKLVNLGFAGVGVVVLLLLFVILIRDQPANAATQKLRNRFLTWGMSFAFFCGVLAFAGPLLAPRQAVAEPPQMALAFSPKFQTEGLTLPDIMVGQKKVQPMEYFTAEKGMVLVQLDDTLGDVKKLRNTGADLGMQLIEARKQTQQALDELAKAKAPSETAPPPPPEVKTAADTSQAATLEIVNAIKAGQLTRLDESRKTMNTATAASLEANRRFIHRMTQ